MSEELLLRGFVSGLFALSFSVHVFLRYDDEVSDSYAVPSRQKYLPYNPGNVLLVFLLMMIILGTCFYGFSGTARMVLSVCFTIFPYIAVYYLVLLLILPFFRKIISARACAMLWLIPNYLYVIQYRFMELPSPLLVLTAPGNLAWILLAVWFAGFAAVLIWKITEHLNYRHRILKNAVPVTEPEVISVWNQVIEDSRFRKPKFSLVSSPVVTTPLTIGLFSRTTKVILPHRKYSADDLELILRHEIVHIGREDAQSKFFMVFCAAVCWFNPLMWVAMRKSANDMERSCDETVLLNADAAKRRQYASLLLNTASDERGFTSCLSTSAKAMHYRLKCIVNPAKRLTDTQHLIGILLVGVIFFAMCMTSGYVALAYDGDSGADIIYQSESRSDFTICHVSSADDTFEIQYEVADEDAFHDYLAGLTLFDLTGNYSFSDSQKSFTYQLGTPNGILALILYDNAIKIVPMYEGRPEASYYYVPDGIDWAYLSTIIIAYPAMNVYPNRDADDYPDVMGAALSRLWRTTDSGRTLVFEDGRPDNDYGGIYTSTPYDNASFTFSQDLAAPFTLQIESLDNSERDTITQTDLSQPFTLDLPDFAANYTVYASFIDSHGNLCEAEFRFFICH